MRTTVTLDSDAEQIIRERMKARRIPFKRALNELIREAGTRRSDYRFTTATFSSEILVDLTHANRVLADMDDAAFLDVTARLEAGAPES